MKKKIKDLFKLGNVAIFGLRGRGKDMLMANIIARSKSPKYISNVDYKIKNKEFIDLNLLDFNINNDFNNFITSDINKYVYPFEDNIDIYISDVGTYFPSQYNGELDKKYKWFGSYIALSRHLGDNNVHFNVQNLNRTWNKLREQSDIYLECRSCIVIHKLVLMKVRYYELEQSALDRVPPFKLKLPLLGNRTSRELYRIEKEKYRINHGVIKEYLLIFFNKSNYDTRIFKTKLEKGA